jgi:hypothetical protein
MSLKDGQKKLDELATQEGELRKKRELVGDQKTSLSWTKIAGIAGVLAVPIGILSIIGYDKLTGGSSAAASGSAASSAGSASAPASSASAALPPSSSASQKAKRRH